MGLIEALYSYFGHLSLVMERPGHSFQLIRENERGEGFEKLIAALKFQAILIPFNNKA